MSSIAHLTVSTGAPRPEEPGATQSPGPLVSESPFNLDLAIMTPAAGSAGSGTPGTRKGIGASPDKHGVPRRRNDRAGASGTTTNKGSPSWASTTAGSWRPAQAQSPTSALADLVPKPARHSRQSPPEREVIVSRTRRDGTPVAGAAARSASGPARGSVSAGRGGGMHGSVSTGALGRSDAMGVVSGVGLRGADVGKGGSRSTRGAYPGRARSNSRSSTVSDDSGGARDRPPTSGGSALRPSAALLGTRPLLGPGPRASGKRVAFGSGRVRLAPIRASPSVVVSPPPMPEFGAGASQKPPGGSKAIVATGQSVQPAPVAPAPAPPAVGEPVGFSFAALEAGTFPAPGVGTGGSGSSPAPAVAGHNRSHTAAVGKRTRRTQTGGGRHASNSRSSPSHAFGTHKRSPTRGGGSIMSPAAAAFAANDPEQHAKVLARLGVSKEEVVNRKAMSMLGIQSLDAARIESREHESAAANAKALTMLGIDDVRDVKRGDDLAKSVAPTRRRVAAPGAVSAKARAMLGMHGGEPDAALAVGGKPAVPPHGKRGRAVAAADVGATGLSSKALALLGADEGAVHDQRSRMLGQVGSGGKGARNPRARA